MEGDITVKVTILVPKQVLMQVRQYYASNQVERYKIVYGEKEIRIEKRLKERKPWKILGANYKEFDSITFADYIGGIAEQIESSQHPPAEVYIHPKNKG